MRRAVVVILVLALVVVVADFLLRAAAENAAAKLIAKKVTQKGEPDVDLGGFPFLVSAVSGRFDRITIDIASATEGALVVEDIHLTLEDVDLEAMEVLGGKGTIRAGSLRGRGIISEGTLNRIISASEPELRVEVEKGSILVSGAGFSAPANAVVAANRLLISAGDVVGPLEVPLPSLLPEVRFSSLRPEPDRLVLGVLASKVRIRP